jgi:hypothetical protein
MTYVYVRKDLTHITDPQEQTLLKAFLKALYDDKYVAECEESFGFVRVSGELKTRALAAIDTLQVTAGAQDWIFEEATAARTGMADYVISQKRKSYSELEQDGVVGLVDSLQRQITALLSENSQLVIAVDTLEQKFKVVSTSVDNVEAAAAKTAADAAKGFQDNPMFGDGGSFGEDEETALNAALALSIISFTLWMLALIFIVAKFVFKLF